VGPGAGEQGLGVVLAAVVELFEGAAELPLQVRRGDGRRLYIYIYIYI